MRIAKTGMLGDWDAGVTGVTGVTGISGPIQTRSDEYEVRRNRKNLNITL
jgi:hypothetical protein